MKPAPAVSRMGKDVSMYNPLYGNYFPAFHVKPDIIIGQRKDRDQKDGYEKEYFKNNCLIFHKTNYNKSKIQTSNNKSNSKFKSILLTNSSENQAQFF
jgi:hypothetical protein